MKLSFRGLKSPVGEPGIPARTGMTVPAGTAALPLERELRSSNATRHSALRAGNESRPSSVMHSVSLLVLLAALGGPAAADEYRLGDLVVHGPWAREMPPVAETGAVYFRIESRGSEDRVVSVHTPVAEGAELHTHEMEDGVMKMLRLPSTEVPAQGELVFEPGDRHVMLIGLSRALVAGESFPMTLHFEGAGVIELSVRVRASEEAGYAGLAGPFEEAGHASQADPPRGA